MDDTELIKRHEIDGKLVQLLFDKSYDSWVVTVSKLKSNVWVKLISISSPNKDFILATYDQEIKELSELVSIGAI